MISEAPQAKAVVILVHGMQEYSERYADCCKYLNGCGYSTLRYDLLGHGKELPAAERGYFGQSGWQNLVHQLHSMFSRPMCGFPGSG